MSWPLSQDYNEAVQNPRFNFADAELKLGVPATNSLGLPVVASGNFADVYRLNCGGKSYAVKCFTREVTGLRDRYRAISAHLQRAKLSFTIDFQYLDQGIKIRSTWYPVLKMQWVEGVTLNQFVRNKLGKPEMLDGLIRLWLQMAQKLRDAKIAHADLQHGNVKLVRSTTGKKLQVRLLDYDGMHIPALAKQSSGEAGHPNFQHPSRLCNNLYNAEVDRFPHLVICTAIRALIVGGRQLWDRHDNGDNLLFRQADFGRPDQSKLLRELWQMSDPVVRTLTGRLVLAIRGPLGQEPLITDLLGKGPPPELTATQKQLVSSVLSSGRAKPATTTSLPTAWKPHSPATPIKSVPSWAVRTPIASTLTTLAPQMPILPKIARQLGRPVTRPAYQLAIVGFGILFLGFMFAQLGGNRDPVEEPKALKETQLDAARDPAPIASVNIPSQPKLSQILPQPPAKRTPTPPPTLPVVPTSALGLPNMKDADALAVSSDLKLGTKFTNSRGQVFVYLPPGTFEMGSPITQTGRSEDEGTNGTHTVELTDGFYLAIHETTQGFYQESTGEVPWKGKEFVREGADYPATYISWYDARDKFIKRLNEAEQAAGMLPTGWEYRLPTEAQWEYAARAGSQTQYSFGDDVSQLGKYAWFDDNAWNVDEKYAHRVGQKLPNNWGLYDMAGNVSEWTGDLHGDYPAVNVTNPTGPWGGANRVFRSGGFSTDASFCRPADRNGFSSGSRNYYLGFRLALVQVSSQ